MDSTAFEIEKIKTALSSGKCEDYKPMEKQEDE